MGLAPVVECAAGLRVARRGAPPGAADLRVGPVSDVAAPGHGAVDAQRADGVVWRRHRATEDRLVVEFVDVAVAAVDLGTGLVTFDRALGAESEEHLLLDHLLPLVLAHRGHVVLHAGLVSRGDRGAVLVGSSGAGKSTLTAYAWRHGWTLGGDDGVVVVPAAPPRVQPTYATVRLHPDGAGLVGLADADSTPVLGKVRIGAGGDGPFRLDPVRAAVVALVEPAALGATARFDRIRGIDAHAELFGSTFHAELGPGRLLPAVVDTLADLVDATVVGRLAVPRGVEGLAAAEAVLRHELEAASG